MHIGELNAHRMDMKLENGDLPALPSVAIPNLPLPNPLNFISPPGMPPLPGQVPLDMMPPLPPPHFDSFPGTIFSCSCACFYMGFMKEVDACWNYFEIFFSNLEIVL